nr:reverse transcriptase domain-containing protein [Tanacetum cinerariifolium]
MALHTRIVAFSDQTRFDLTFVSTSWRHSWDPPLGITLRKMSAMANTTFIVTTVTKPATNPGREKTSRDANATPRVNIQDFYEEYYEDILAIIMDKIRRDKQKEVHARLDFGEGYREKRIREDSHYSSARTLFARYHNQSERLKVRDRLRYNDRHVLDRLGHQRQSAFDRLSKNYSPSTTKSRPDMTSSRDRSRGRSRHHRRDSTNGDRPQSRDCSRGVEESYDNSHSSYGTRINHGYRYRDRDRSRHVKRRRDTESPLSRVSESGSSDEGHWKSKSKRHKPTDDDDLTMPWMYKEVDPFTPRIHNFKSSRVARVWFDELPPESIDSYKDLKEAFLAYFMQQKKYVKDPVEIHNIKQKDRETIEEFMKQFKVKTRRMKGAPERMRISRFMHGVNNSELIKRLNEHVSKTMEEMIITTTAFIREEAVAAGKKKGHTSWRTHDQSKRHTHIRGLTSEVSQGKEEGLAGLPPYKDTKRNSYGRGRKVPAATTYGKLSHLIKEINQGRDQSKTVTQSFERVREITFPSLAPSSGTEGLLVIEAEIGGHMIHRMYVDGGSSTEALGNNRRHRSFYKSMDEFHDSHGMLKFPANEGIITIRSTILIPVECATMITSSKEIPKEAGDCYPLPEIDWKVESLRLPFKCFMDAYKGYHQIHLAESDEEKTAFHTGQGVYCYTKMPFSLKNVGATYQRLVDKAFDSQISRNIKVYVDNLVIKSHTEAEMQRDIGETFRTLRKINMKLNPKNIRLRQWKKCLGYMITPEEIKPCPDKKEFVLQLPSPRTIKEKCIKKSDFHWTSKAEESFKKLKQHLLKLPLLVAPKPKEELIVYLSASYGAISAVLMTEKGTVQTPVYFPRGFREISDESPPDASVVETQQEPWTLFTDVLSCVDGSGAGLILTSLEGTDFTYALRFQFTASNNEAEYEALIAGLRIAAQMGVRNVHISVDSKLLANQVLGAYVAKEENMIKYLEKVKKPGTLLGDRKEASKLRIKARQYELLEGVLYRRSFLMLWLRCVRTLQADYPLTPITAPWPFYKWGIDIAGPFPEGPCKSNGLVERANQSLGEGIRARMGDGNKNWIEELPHLLWAHRIMIKSSHGDTPFSLTYGTKTVIPAEIRMPIYSTVAVDTVYNDEEMRLNLDLLEERRERVAIREAKPKLKMTKYYNARVRGVTFRPDDFVYRTNNASHAEDGIKLDPKWEGPYEITEALGDGAYKLRSADGTVLPMTWNVANL